MRLRSVARIPAQTVRFGRLCAASNRSCRIGLSRTDGNNGISTARDLDSVLEGDVLSVLETLRCWACWTVHDDFGESLQAIEGVLWSGSAAGQAHNHRRRT